MMGERTVMQEALFYGFSLEQHVPTDHLLRSMSGLSICLVYASTCGRTTARQAALRSTPS